MSVESDKGLIESYVSVSKRNEDNLQSIRLEVKGPDPGPRCEI